MSQQERREGPFSKPTTVENILSGKAKISLLTDGSDNRIIAGREWLGHSYTYNLTVPHPTKEGENWETTLTVWDALPLTLPRGVYERPKTQLTILTSQGETGFSRDEGTVRKVIDEISRQVSQKEAEETNHSKFG